MNEKEAILVISHDSITGATSVSVEDLEDDDGCPCYCHCDWITCRCVEDHCICVTMTDDEYSNFKRTTRSARGQDEGLPSNN